MTEILYTYNMTYKRFFVKVWLLKYLINKTVKVIFFLTCFCWPERKQAQNKPSWTDKSESGNTTAGGITQGCISGMDIRHTLHGFGTDLPEVTDLHTERLGSGGLCALKETGHQHVELSVHYRQHEEGAAEQLLYVLALTKISCQQASSGRLCHSCGSEALGSLTWPTLCH